MGNKLDGYKIIKIIKNGNSWLFACWLTMQQNQKGLQHTRKDFSTCLCLFEFPAMLSYSKRVQSLIKL